MRGRECCGIGGSGARAAALPAQPARWAGSTETVRISARRDVVGLSGGRGHSERLSARQAGLQAGPAGRQRTAPVGLCRRRAAPPWPGGRRAARPPLARMHGWQGRGSLQHLAIPAGSRAAGNTRGR